MRHRERNEMRTAGLKSGFRRADGFAWAVAAGLRVARLSGWLVVGRYSAALSVKSSFKPSRNRRYASKPPCDCSKSIVPAFHSHYATAPEALCKYSRRTMRMLQKHCVNAPSAPCECSGRTVRLFLKHCANAPKALCECLRRTVRILRTHYANASDALCECSKSTVLASLKHTACASETPRCQHVRSMNPDSDGRTASRGRLRRDFGLHGSPAGWLSVASPPLRPSNLQGAPSTPRRCGVISNDSKC